MTTDYFILPKQALVVFAGIVILTLYGVKTLLLEKVNIRRTPFDLAVVLFLATILLSSIFSTAWADSLSNFIPVLFAGPFVFWDCLQCEKRAIGNGLNRQSFNRSLPLGRFPDSIAS